MLPVLQNSIPPQEAFTQLLTLDAIRPRCISHQSCLHMALRIDKGYVGQAINTEPLGPNIVLQNPWKCRTSGLTMVRAAENIQAITGQTSDCHWPTLTHPDPFGAPSLERRRLHPRSQTRRRSQLAAWGREELVPSAGNQDTNQPQNLQSPAFLTSRPECRSAHKTSQD